MENENVTNIIPRKMELDLLATSKGEEEVEKEAEVTTQPGKEKKRTKEKAAGSRGVRVAKKEEEQFLSLEQCEELVLNSTFKVTEMAKWIEHYGVLKNKLFVLNKQKEAGGISGGFRRYYVCSAWQRGCKAKLAIGRDITKGEKVEKSSSPTKKKKKEKHANRALGKEEEEDAEDEGEEEEEACCSPSSPPSEQLWFVLRDETNFVHSPECNSTRKLSAELLAAALPFRKFILLKNVTKPRALYDFVTDVLGSHTTRDIISRARDMVLASKLDERQRSEERMSKKRRKEDSKGARKKPTAASSKKRLSLSPEDGGGVGTKKEKYCNESDREEEAKKEEAAGGDFGSEESSHSHNLFSALVAEAVKETESTSNVQ